MSAAAEKFLDEAKALACVHCGLCLGSCPTYLQTGNENESPRGRIYLMRALQSGRLPLDEGSARHIDLCLGCRACETACPSGVQYGALLEETRDFIERNHRRPLRASLLRRVLIERIFPVPWRMKLALLPARLLKSALRATGAEKLLPKALRGPLDLLPDTMSSEALPEFSPAETQPAKGTVGFVTGCVMSVMFARTNAASARLLNRAGYDVVAPRGQGCCGALFAHSGQLAAAREQAVRNMAVFKNRRLDAVIINAAGCGSTLKEYGHLLAEDAAHYEAGREFSARVFDLTEFLAEQGFAKRKFKPWAGMVTYHDACHLAHPQRITRQPRELVRAVAGANYAELPEADLCCGSAGSYNLTEPEMARGLQQRKIENILKTRAATVVTTNPGCLLQIQSGLEPALRKKLRVLHIADFLEEALAD